ncbi:uncharacterized protein LOC127718723 [Mytilus californianus]|uniref:uncharacterized protein LOC127718723 n=1 Tax=Mytilus californianus TaxID=6549 RepID=UPI0022482CCE|nr:uncharacterized protein LOC127718723 [Mytilus californianus]
MPCNKTLQSVVVKSGDSLILNCTCFNKSNGQWTGLDRRPSSASEKYIPYTHGTDLNPSLNKSKYMVFGGYDDSTCYLKIMNFMSDDDGKYMCQYISSETVHINVYNVVATKYMGDTSSVNHDGKKTKTETYTFETKRIAVPDKTSLSLEWMLPLIVIIITFGVVTTILLWRRKDKSESTTSWIEDIEENAQGDSVDNRLYHASEILEINNRQRHNRVSRNQALSSSQIHTDEGYSGVNGKRYCIFL